MPRYLVVDDTDGRVLIELADAGQALQLLACLERSPHGDPHVSLVRLDDSQGDLIGVTSRIAMRPLAPLEEQPAGTEESSGRRIGRRVRHGRR